MFKQAYLKLTIFYVTLLLVLSVLFSFWLYKEATRELTIGLHAPFTTRTTTGFMTFESTFDQDSYLQERINEGKRRVLVNLVSLNIIVLIGGGAASYWLARRTMQPIEDAMRMQNRFTADASHELRTPLAAMKLENEIALRSLPKLSKEVKQLLGSNLEEIDRMSKLSEDLLLLARGESADVKEEVDVDEIISGAVKQTTPLANAKSISLHTKVEPMKIVVHKDALQRAVIILLDNAIKYSGKKTTVTTSATKKNREVRITVADQGPGINEEQAKLIFDRFYRGDDSRTSGKVVGHGLGLSIAQKIVAEHGGSIYLKPTKTPGASFVVKLPL